MVTIAGLDPLGDADALALTVVQRVAPAVIRVAGARRPGPGGGIPNGPGRGRRRRAGRGGDAGLDRPATPARWR